MKLAILLHFYQPHTQQDDILERIVNECYRPLLQGLLDRPRSRVIVNISGVLTALLMKKGYKDVIDAVISLVRTGQIELTESSLYHAILPLLDEEEIVRQIKLDKEVNSATFGDLYKPVGFFPPELAVDKKLFDILHRLNYKWVVAPSSACNSTDNTPDKLYKITKTNTYVFFRNKRISSLILSAVVRNAEDLYKEAQDAYRSQKYWFVVMDAETFGHHRIGHEKVLFDVLDSGRFVTVTAADLLKENLKTNSVALRPSTWTNEEQDFWLDKDETRAAAGKSFMLWQDSKNPIHKLQWKLTELAITSVRVFSDKKAKRWQDARKKLDYALASDQYWWASAKPWWSLEMIEQGAYNLKDVIITLNTTYSTTQKAENLYRGILDKAFEWQRTGYIRKQHLENSSTFMKEPFNKRAPAEWYNQIVLEFEDAMDRATQNQDFEKAIKWRDALIKLKQGTDIYDVLHVVDELWSARNIPEVKPFLEHRWEEFSAFAKEHFRDVKNKEVFEQWKNKMLDKTTLAGNLSALVNE